MSDYASLRRIMVDCQVRTSDVTSFPVIEAMLAVPRERHVPEDRRAMAYVGKNLALAPDRVILEPRSLAKMLDALAIRPTELVLDVGCTLGYSSAVAARLAEAVVAVEEDPVLADEAQAILARAGIDNASVVTAPLTEGAARHGPYDVIMLQGGVEQFPAALAAQLKPGGRAACIFISGPVGVCRLGRKVGDDISWRDMFHATAPVLPGFARAPAFQF